MPEQVLPPVTVQLSLIISPITFPEKFRKIGWGFCADASFGKVSSRVAKSRIVEFKEFLSFIIKQTIPWEKG